MYSPTLSRKPGSQLPSPEAFVDEEGSWVDVAVVAVAAASFTVKTVELDAAPRSVAADAEMSNLVMYCRVGVVCRSGCRGETAGLPSVVVLLLPAAAVL